MVQWDSIQPFWMLLPKVTMPTGLWEAELTRSSTDLLSKLLPWPWNQPFYTHLTLTNRWVSCNLSEISWTIWSTLPSFFENLCFWQLLYSYGPLPSAPTSSLPTTAWTTSVTWFTGHKLASTKILQNLWQILAFIIHFCINLLSHYPKDNSAIISNKFSLRTFYASFACNSRYHIS